MCSQTFHSEYREGRKGRVCKEGGEIGSKDESGRQRTNGRMEVYEIRDSRQEANKGRT